MFIADDRTPPLLRSEERQHHRISGQTFAALPNGAEDRGDIVAINIALLRSEDDSKLALHDEAHVGFVLLDGALQ